MWLEGELGSLIHFVAEKTVSAIPKEVQVKKKAKGVPEREKNREWGELQTTSLWVGGRGKLLWKKKYIRTFLNPRKNGAKKGGVTI